MSYEEAWASNDHFSADGTLIEAWASTKSFRPREEEEEEEEEDEDQNQDLRCGKILDHELREYTTHEKEKKIHRRVQDSGD